MPKMHRQNFVVLDQHSSISNHGLFPSVQAAKDEASHKAKRAADDAAAKAESSKYEAKGFGARLWGKGQVRPSAAVGVGDMVCTL